ncbi:hypothetical protein BH10PSE2_BH10PSE2_28450 [soil metagenome]
MSWIQAANPTAPITTEAEAQAAARSSAIAIVIGVVYGLIGIAITFATMGTIKAAAVAQAGANGGPANTGAIAETAVSIGVWVGIAFVVIQAVLAVMQWRNPNKVIAIMFLLLIALGVASTLASVVLLNSGALPQTSVATPIWQVVLAVIVMAVEAVLHFAGLRGMRRLDAIQMEAAR